MTIAIFKNNIHPGRQIQLQAEISLLFVIELLKREEASLGIPEEHRGRSVVTEDAYNAPRTQHLPSVHDAYGYSPQRLRHSRPSRIDMTPPKQASHQYWYTQIF